MKEKCRWYRDRNRKGCNTMQLSSRTIGGEAAHSILKKKAPLPSVMNTKKMYSYFSLTLNPIRQE